MGWTRGENSASVCVIFESVTEDGVVGGTFEQEQKMAEVNGTGMYTCVVGIAGSLMFLYRYNLQRYYF